MKPQEIRLKQKEVLANFYANFAIVWLAAGFVAPIFSPIENKVIFAVRLLISLIIGRILLQVCIDKLK